jgi:subtilisin family serine protease
MLKKLQWFSVFLILFVLAFSINTSPVRSAPDDSVRIWVQYQPGQGQAVRSLLQSKKAQFHYAFADLDAYVVSLPSQALAGILNNPHVLGVEEDAKRYPLAPTQRTPFSEALGLSADTVDANGQTVPWGIDAVQARDVWDSNRDGAVDSGAPTGAGRTVCVIDTGYYEGHEDLPAAVGGYSQVDADWTTDGAGHGTHVAGTIDGVNNSLGVVGVSPGEISLYIIKIFDNDGLWTNASDLVAAINQCSDNGANVISMSLGGPRPNGLEKRAFNNLYQAGILHVAAAGNDGNTDDNYPASYDSVISVAAVDESLTVADFSQQTDQVELAAPGVGVLSTVPFVDTSTVTVDGVDYDALHIENAARGTASGTLVDGGLCDTTGTWTGAVVLCQRGAISFYDKVMNVQNSGGAAALIFNNEPGNFLGTLDVGNTSEIIALSLSQEDGTFLFENKLGSVASVYSELSWPTSSYEAWGGTSMATPHVSAVAALIWSANPTLSNQEIREAMNATALELGAAGRDNAYGYGLVRAYDALQYLGGGSGTDEPPSISITAPAAGTTVADIVIITANASDDVGVAQVEFFVDGSSLGFDDIGSDGWSASWDTTAFADGLHTVSAAATDTAGQSASDSVSVTVDNSGGVTYPIDLSVTAYKVRGSQYADLVWSGANTTHVDIYRDGVIVNTTLNDGSETDITGQKGGGTAFYQVCEAGNTTNCSNEVTADW